MSSTRPRSACMVQLSRCSRRFNIFLEQTMRFFRESTQTGEYTQLQKAKLLYNQLNVIQSNTDNYRTELIGILDTIQQCREMPTQDAPTNDNGMRFDVDTEQNIFYNGPLSGLELERKLADEELMPLKTENDNDSISSEKNDENVAIESSVMGGASIETMALYKPVEEIIPGPEEFKIDRTDVEANHDERIRCGLKTIQSKAESKLTSLPETNKNGEIPTTLDKAKGATKPSSFVRKNIGIFKGVGNFPQEISSKSLTNQEGKHANTEDDQRNPKTMKRQEDRRAIERLADSTSKENKQRPCPPTSGADNELNPTKIYRPPIPSQSPHLPLTTDLASNLVPFSRLDDFKAIETAIEQPESEHYQEQEGFPLLEKIGQNNDKGEVSKDEMVKNVINPQDGMDIVQEGTQNDLLKEFKEEVNLDKIRVEEIIIIDDDVDVAISDDDMKDRTKIVPHKRRRKESDFDTTDSDTSDSKPKTAGRRNSRTLLSKERLTAATREATLREKQRLKRLEQKQKRLDNLPQINEHRPCPPTSGADNEMNPTKLHRPPIPSQSPHLPLTTDLASNLVPFSRLDDLQAIETALEQPESEHYQEQKGFPLLEKIGQNNDKGEVSKDEMVKNVINPQDGMDIVQEGTQNDLLKEFKEEVNLDKIRVEEIIIIDDDVDVAISDDDMKDRTKIVPHKRRRKESDFDTTDSDTSDSKPKTAGRRNSRTLLSKERLTAATREATLREKQRLKRLEQKQKRLDNLPQINEHRPCPPTSGADNELNPTKLHRPPIPSQSPHLPLRTDLASNLVPFSRLDDFQAIETALEQPESEHYQEQKGFPLLEKIGENNDKGEVSKDEMVKNVINPQDGMDIVQEGTQNDLLKEFKEEVNLDKIRVEEIIILDDDVDVAISDDVMKDRTKIVPHKRRRKESDFDTTDSDNSDTSDSKPKTAGRRNIRTLLSKERLTAATREATLREKQRLKRLEQKQKRLDNLLQISEPEPYRLILDITEGQIIAVDPILSRRMKEHQVNGVKFMWDACYESVNVLKTESGAGCILAHCMGLGKTFQVVSLVHTLFSYPMTNTKHVLIVCSLSTVLNWQNEFNFGFDIANSEKVFNVFIISHQKDKKSKVNVIRNWWEQNGVLIIGYDCYTILTQRSKNLKRKPSFDMTDALVNPGPDLVICDEGHRLKNFNSQCTKALMRIKTLRRIILTGIPLQNYLLEYYSMVHFVKPGLLGTVKEFRNRFENPITNGQYRDSTQRDIKLMKKRRNVLNSTLKGTVQRYEVTELEHYLPEKKEYVVFVTLHEVQATLYKIYIDHFKTNRQTQFLSHFHLLQSTWTHPQLLYTKDKMALEKKNNKKEIDTIIIDDVNEEQIESLDLPTGWWKNYVPQDYHHNLAYGPKLKVMMAIVKEAMAIKEKVLIFSSSILVLDLIQKVLTTEFVGWRICRDFLRMDGTVSPEQRQKLCTMFNHAGYDRNKVFLISHKVGGIGLNLVAANRVILMDICWNPAIEAQSIFRVYRFGQNKPCYIYRLVSKNTMEEAIYKSSVTKQAISGRMVDETRINRDYSLEDMREMYNFDYRPNQERPTLKLPSDKLLANVIQDLKTEIFSYHEHESILVNIPEEEDFL